MKTKKIIFAAIMIFSTSLIIAQTAEKGKTSFAVLGGVNFQTFNGKDGAGDKINDDMLIGYHAGFNVAFPLAPQFYFQPGVMFSTKGSKNTQLGITRTTKLSYIEVPVNFVYRGSLGSGFILVGFGPYVGYGIMGKNTYEGEPLTLDTDVEFKNVVEVTDPVLTKYFKALDAGGNIFFGYEMAGGIFLQLNAQLGLLNIKPENRLGSNPKVMNTGYGLSLGYRF